MTKIENAVLVAALKRCLSESGWETLNQGRYARWRASLPDRRTVPGPLAFGNAVEFEEFCQSHGVPCLPAQKKVESVARYFGSTRELRRVVERFLAESEDHAGDAYDAWRAELVATGESVPTSATLRARLGGWSEIVGGESNHQARHQLSLREKLERVAEKVAIVEAEIGPSPTGRLWNELRSERPDLGLHQHGTIQNYRWMPWKELVSPKRTWPENLDALEASLSSLPQAS